MKRLAMVLLVAGTTLANAAEHQMRINEVLVSNNGSNAAQFVELHDLAIGGESFPLGPYKLEVFDAAGVSIGSTSLTITPTPAIDRYIATAAADTAFGTTRQDTLATVLPVNGQACFEDNANTKIQCVAWGCITHFVQPGVVRAPTPPDGMSAQRQPDGTYTIAAPTPQNPTNATGTAGAACPTDPKDAAPPPDAAIPIDAPPNQNNTDAGIHDPNQPGGGCCNVDDRATVGTFVLALAVMSFSRRRRRP